MKKRFKKTLLTLFVSINIFALLSPTARAFDYPSPVDSMNQTMDDLGVNKDELKNMVQSMNTSRQKRQAPQVSLSFQPSNPVNGQQVTAVATPTYFMNDGKNLYFTWYLESADCDRDDNPNKEKKDKCDLNNDGRIDIKDYKIKATRIIAGNDFEWNKPGAYDGTKSDGGGYLAALGGDDQRGKKPYCYIHDTESGDEYQIGCGHLFPNAPGEESGDGKFTTTEERFWHTDPNSPDTAGTGNGDEANVVGMGINTFKWNYTSGDKVGIAVEGISVEPSQSYDSSYKTMFALLKNKCDLGGSSVNGYPKTEVISTTEVTDPVTGYITTTEISTTTTVLSRTEYNATFSITASKTITVKDAQKNIISTETTTYTDDGYPKEETRQLSKDELTPEKIKSVSDINTCLYDNMTKPSEGGGAADKMDITLSYSPDFPINDPSGVDGDKVTIHSTITNLQSEGYTTYSWQVFEGDDPNPDSWGEPMSKSEIPGVEQTSGIGLNEFKFKMNFKSPKKYLRIKLVATENVESGTKREGHSDIVIPVASTNDRIHVFGSVLNANGQTLSLGKTERCTEGIDNVICPITKDEILGLKFSSESTKDFDFSWSVDGDPISYKECFFDGCNPEKQTNVAFFPALDEIGTRYNVNLVATNQKTGEKVNLNRAFEIVDPKAYIVSEDANICRPKLLGNYVDLDGKLWPDYSKSNFIALTGRSIVLNTVFDGISTAPENLKWIVDGKVVNSTNANALGYNINATTGALTLPSKYSGETYTVSVSGIITQSNAVKKMLNLHWGKSYTDFYEKPISATIEIMTVDSLPGSTTSQKTTPKIMASIISSTPQYLAFLLRIVLTIGIVIFSARFILSLAPRSRGSE